MRRERERDQKKYLRKYAWKFSRPEERNRYPSTGSTEGPKQDETKQDLHQDILIIMTKEYDNIQNPERENLAT